MPTILDEAGTAILDEGAGLIYDEAGLVTFPGSPPNPLGIKVELLLNNTWTDITLYVMLRDSITLTGIGRTDETGSMAASTATMVLRNDGRFTPKNSASPYYPYITRNTQVRISINATSVLNVLLPAINANTGFETNAANWTGANGAVIAQSTAQAHTGTGSMSLHGDGTTANPHADSEKEPVTPGVQYTATAWYFTGSTWASGVGTQINWYDASGSFISNSFNFPGTALPGGTWTQVSVTGTAPPNAAQASVSTYISGTPASGTLFFIDDASLSPASGNGVPYNQYRFFGEIASWPPSSDISQRDTFVQVTASDIWRRIQASQQAIGSAYWRYVTLLTGLNVPVAYWSMEDGTGSTAFVLTGGAGTNMVPTGTPSYAADGTSFPGCNALMQPNGARIAANVTAGPTPTNNVLRFALSVPSAGDSNATAIADGGIIATMLTAGTIGRFDVALVANQLKVIAYSTSAGGTPLFTGTITPKVNGTPLLVSLEVTPSGGSINWALNAIAPGAGSAFGTATGTRGSTTIGAVSQIQLNPQGRLQDTTIGQAGLWYTVPSLTTAASAIGGWNGEAAVTRIQRICGESNIPVTIIGSASAALGPQVSDTMQNVLQEIEAGDGGLLSASRDQFGLTYRTLASMQNQSPAAAFSFASGVLGAPLAPTYDDLLLANSWQVTNYDGYQVQAQVTSGAVSVQPPPNGVGNGYAKTKTVSVNTHAQVSALATQLLFQGSVDDLRFPTVTFNFQRYQAAPYFAAIPGLRLGDYLAVGSMPSYLGGGTAKQLVWGYTERMGANPHGWTIEYSTIPEAPFETSFSPGVYAVTQSPSGTVAQGSSVGSSVSGSQIGSGAVSVPQVQSTLSARTIGGTTSFISAATPYDWSFTVSGSPADSTYFTATQDQALPIAVGDTFTSSLGLGGPFTVTSVDPPSGGTVNVHFTPTASAAMNSGTVSGGKNGDEWVNSSGGNQVSIWTNGAWVPVTWNAASVLTASSITSSLVAAGTVIAGVVDGTTITGAKFVANGTSGEFLAYSGTPAAGNLVVGISPVSGSDSFGNAYTAGLLVSQGQLILANSSTPSASSIGPVVFGQSNGSLQVVDSLDSQLYGTQYRMRVVSSNQVSNSTSALAITDTNLTTGIRSYFIEGWLAGNVSGANATAPRFRMSGPTTSTVRIVYQVSQESDSGGLHTDGSFSVLGTFSTAPATANSIPSGASFSIRFAGYVTFTASGTTQLQIGCGAASTQWTMYAGSAVKYTPL